MSVCTMSGVRCAECQTCFTAQGVCEACVSCQRCVSAQGGAPGPAAGKPAPTAMNYFVFLTNDCNLRCDYCFATKTPAAMGPETILRVIDFLLEDEFKRLGEHSVSVQFFGGEPTYKWDALVEFVERANVRARFFKRPAIRWGMTTNATLLTAERLRWLRHHGVKPLVSIDGPKDIHNLHRSGGSIGGSFQMIDLDALRRYFPNCEIRPTIMPDTVADFPATLRWFYERELFNIATEVAYEADWTSEAMEAARRTYEALGDVYIYRKRAGLPMWMKFIEDGRNAGAAAPTGQVCGTARNSIGIDAAGDLYACQRYASMNDPTKVIGNVRTGFEAGKLALAQFMERADMFPDPAGDFFCEECLARGRCQGGCNAANVDLCGDRRVIPQVYCRFQRLWQAVTFRVLAATGELWNARPHGGPSCR